MDIQRFILQTLELDEDFLTLQAKKTDSKGLFESFILPSKKFFWKKLG